MAVRNKTYVIIISLIAGALFVHFLNETHPSHTLSAIDRLQIPRERQLERLPAALSSTANRVGAPTEGKDLLALTKVERDSVDRMAEMLFAGTKSESSLASFVDELEAEGQHPIVTHDANAFTGSMAIVRTERPLQGTRYLHAQYFADESGKSFIQHASFEIKPAVNSMATAEAAARLAFKNLSRPSQRTSDFVEWTLDDNHVVWIKKMGLDDLQDNPFNAYTANDVGTVRLAFEVRIHEDDEN